MIRTVAQYRDDPLPVKPKRAGKAFSWTATGRNPVSSPVYGTTAPMKQAARNVRSYFGGIIRGERPYAARSARLESALTPSKTQKKELPPKGRPRDASTTSTLPSPKKPPKPYFNSTQVQKWSRQLKRNSLSPFDPCRTKPSSRKAGLARQEQKRNPASGSGMAGPRLFKKWC